jgi:hypothetical protein
MRLNYGQTPIDVSGTVFPKVSPEDGKPERFWYVKSEFIRHADRLLKEGKMFTHISGHLVGNRWECAGQSISISDVASFVWSLRLFYMKSECMSIDSVCSYMEENVNNIYVRKFNRHMRDNWKEVMDRDALLMCKNYPGPIKTNKNLIDTLLYSGNFHSQEKYKNRYDELLEYMDESLIFMSTYNALHSGYQMMQISRSLSELREDNLVVLLPNHLQHEWDDNCSYKEYNDSRNK